MPIHVTCPGCHARFSVSDKFAGRTGPCPKCKKPIQIPKAEEQVTIHEREHEGVKDAKGRLVLKPVARKEAKIRPLAAAGIGGTVVLVIACAVVLRFTATYDEQGYAQVSVWLLAAGAIVLAPPLVIGGYAFLRNDELAPYRRQALWIRTLICAAVYAALWGVLTMLPEDLTQFSNEIWMAGIVLPPFLIVGSLAAFATLDLDASSAFFHYALYALSCVLLRVLMGLPAI
jgi:cation transport ATPase